MVQEILVCTIATGKWRSVIDVVCNSSARTCYLV